MKTKSLLNGQICLLIVVCLALLVSRVVIKQEIRYLFLAWNLLLAFIPYWLTVRLQQKERKLIFNLVIIGIWLLFFPNAPYLVTDFIHINKSNSTIIWFDVVLLFMFSSTGMYMAIKSLDIIHTWIHNNTNRLIGMITISIAIILSGFGIYLGRIERWNSWDIIHKPVSLFKNIGNLIENPHVWEFTLVYALLVATLYAIFRIENQKVNQTKRSSI